MLRESREPSLWASPLRAGKTQSHYSVHFRVKSEYLSGVKYWHPEYCIDLKVIILAAHHRFHFQQISISLPARKRGMRCRIPLTFSDSLNAAQSASTGPAPPRRAVGLRLWNVSAGLFRQRFKFKFKCRFKDPAVAGPRG